MAISLGSALLASATAALGVGSVVVVATTSGPWRGGAREAAHENTPVVGSAEVPAGVVQTITGGPDSKGPPVDGPPGAARFGEPSGVALRAGGQMIVVDFLNRIVLTIDDQGNSTRIGGSGEQGTADGPALTSSFYGPSDVAVASDGAIFIADGAGHRIRELRDGKLTTLAGGGQPGLSTGSFADGPGADARFDNAAGIAVDLDGTLLVADYNNNRIRRVTRSGLVTTVAGTGEYGSKDGPAMSANFAYPVALAVDSTGAIYVLEHGNNALRKIGRDGTVSTVVPRTLPFTADSALSYASAVAVDDVGTVYIADTGADRLLKIAADGKVQVIVGRTGDPGFVDGAAGQAKVKGPQGLAWSPTTNSLIFVDTGNSAIRKVGF
jgi:sugar lactone lactonase YvrE